jgi:hypothetical protein
MVTPFLQLGKVQAVILLTENGITIPKGQQVMLNLWKKKIARNDQCQTEASIQTSKNATGEGRRNIMDRY